MRKGIYAKPEYDALELACKVYTPSYISLETVLEKEGVIFQYYNRIFAVSYLTREIKAGKGGIVYRKIRNPILLNPAGITQNERYAIATKERAFLDALYLYKKYNFDNVSILNKEEVTNLLPIYNSKTLEKNARSVLK